MDQIDAEFRAGLKAGIELRLRRIHTAATRASPSEEDLQFLQEFEPWCNSSMIDERGILTRNRQDALERIRRQIEPLISDLAKIEGFPWPESFNDLVETQEAITLLERMESNQAAPSVEDRLAKVESEVAELQAERERRRQYELEQSEYRG